MSKPLRIGLLERSLSDRIRVVGELLQPGGAIALKNLEIESCLEGIDAIPVKVISWLKVGKGTYTVP